ncbi:MAG TPA: hypothetical protein PLV86_06500 [Candidatus Fermentibacter daniensis]|jgi:hypothetical protein|nr:MAG: hypothetical protein AO395_06050 [Candidatus Fermentibacter daniensis]MBP7720129.1 hypothetical protein [Candidatus Fermentibacter sp.]MCC6870983.1 hypothetical protein [Candidatus Fermentibacter sp.]NLI03434.1 hypothetical protein [Candidatus Fermentibacter daniensis]HOD20160.1 hypothetical protein [Candidatus Fermentibacter daniensis]
MLTLVPVMILSIGVCPGIKILSEGCCTIPAESWFPLHLNGYEASALACPGFTATRIVYSPPVANGMEAWSVVEAPDGSLQCGVIDMSFVPVITRFQPEDARGWQALACVSQADTLWTCLLEGTDEWENGPVVSGSQESGYLLGSRPDCSRNWTRIARIAPTGEVIFSTLLTSVYLLDLQEPIGETGPSVASLDMTSSGDVVVAGRVSQWYTSPEEWFVCLLDGETGIPIWKATGAGMGLAGLYQVIEAPSGVLIGVGATSPAGDGRNPWVWGQEHPLIVVIGQDGSVLMEETPALGTGVSLSGIAPLDATDCFLAVGKRPEARWMEVFRLRIATGTHCP